MCLDNGRLIVVSALEGRMDYYKKYLSLWDEKDPDCHIAFLGNLIYSTDDDDKSIEILEDAIEKSEKYDNFHYLMGINEVSLTEDEDIYLMGFNLTEKFKDLIFRKKGSLEPYLSQYIDFFKTSDYFIETDKGLFFTHISPDYPPLTTSHRILEIKNFYETFNSADEFLNHFNKKFMIVGNHPYDDDYEITSRKLNLSSGNFRKNKTYLDVDLTKDYDSMEKLIDCLYYLDENGKSVKYANIKVTDKAAERCPEELIDNHDKNSSKKAKNFEYIDNLIRSGANEIILDSNIVLSESEESAYANGIELDIDDLTIDGNGHTIDAQDKARIFCVTGKNITLKNLTLKNGHKNKGGAIKTGRNAKLTVKNCRFTNNEAQNGGAIHNIGKLTITQSSLKNNTAEGFGGAIHNVGKLTITESKLTQNTAKIDGGAISNNKGNISISDSAFMQNNAQDGGAIYNQTVYQITLKGVRLHDEAINGLGEITISESAFSENTTRKKGGAINNRAILNVLNCNFSNNNSRTSIIHNTDSLQIRKSNFTSNNAQNIIVNDGDLANLSVFKGEFKYNTLSRSMIFNQGKSCFIEKTVFKNHLINAIINKSNLILINPEINGKGKIILNEKYVLIKKSDDDLENKIYGEGTVENEKRFKFKRFDFGYLDRKIREGTTNEIILKEDISLENYERDYYEGGIELDRDNLVIDGNGHTIDAQAKTRIFYCTANNITLKNLTLKNGHSHRSYDNSFNNHGGAIKINRNKKLNIENCKFINNVSEGKGGAINSQNNKIIIKESVLEKNASRTDGGAIDNIDGEITVISSALIENAAKNDGGAINNNKGKITIISSIFHENETEMYGGAIHNSYGEITMEKSMLNGNSSNGGGAIKSFKGILTIKESVFNENIADDGGAIHNSNGETTMEKSMLNGNSSCTGGAIYNQGKLKIIESTLKENTAKEFYARYGEGGAIYNDPDGELTISESTLQENTAQKEGGAIYNIGKIKITESTVKENEPDDVC